MINYNYYTEALRQMLLEKSVGFIDSLFITHSLSSSLILSTSKKAKADISPKFQSIFNSSILKFLIVYDDIL